MSSVGEPVEDRHRADTVGLQVGQHVGPEALLGELSEQKSWQTPVSTCVVDGQIIRLFILQRDQKRGVVKPGLRLVPAGKIVPQL